MYWECSDREPMWCWKLLVLTMGRREVSDSHERHLLLQALSELRQDITPGEEGCELAMAVARPATHSGEGMGGCTGDREKGRGGHRCQSHEGRVLLQAVGKASGVSRLCGDVAQGDEQALVQLGLQVLQQPHKQLGLGLPRGFRNQLHRQCSFCTPCTTRQVPISCISHSGRERRARYGHTARQIKCIYARQYFVAFGLGAVLAKLVAAAIYSQSCNQQKQLRPNP